MCLNSYVTPDFHGDLNSPNTVAFLLHGKHHLPNRAFHPKEGRTVLRQCARPVCARPQVEETLNRIKTHKGVSGGRSDLTDHR